MDISEDSKKTGSDRKDAKPTKERNSRTTTPKAKPNSVETRPAPEQESDGLSSRELLGVLNSFRNGDFSVRLPHDLTGLDGRVAEVFNEVISMNEWLTDELAGLNKVVGQEGKISRRISIGGARGGWATQVESVNALVSDLVHPISETSRVIGAVAQGDLAQTMRLDIEGRPLAGEFLRTAKTVNRMVDQLGSFAAEVTRVAREVGTEGKLGGQARLKGVAGTWKDLTDSVNSMAGNLTSQVRNVATVTTAVANGDLSKKITVDVHGEMLELKDTINTMVDQLNSFASEVTRVAREVGTEGKLGGQAEVKGVAGTWKDLTDSVNSMAGNLTGQVRNIATVTTAVANGDLTKKITVNAQGEILELKNTINTMVDQLSSFADEVTRVAKEVGTEGELGGQADVKGVAGTWKDLTDNVNLMATNLTVQLRDVSKVATAIATGDLTQKVTVNVKGEILQIKNVINTMVDQLSSFAAEVTRVAKEVGTEGELGGQADVKGVAGTWKDLTDSVNSMAGNLTSQVRNIAAVTTAVANGDLSKKITVTVKGEMLELKNTINTMVDQLNSFASEVTRVAREVGTEGKLGGQADVKGVAGTWKDLTDNVNSMAGNLTGQVRNIAAVTTAVATGDLSKKITVDAQGEILELKSTINTMVDQLSSFAAEVTRVAREVGTEGKLGGQADVKGVAGTWEDLTDSVNSMAGNLTDQVRNIAAVTTAVANGDLSKKITVDVKGEILELKNTINTMVDQLRSFAAEVTRVAREVGTEGKLGGQASVPGAAGTWRDLTDNVNSMAGNLTGQVRNIATVTTAVANGDLSKKITVDVRGEIAELKDTINTMVDQLNSFASEVTRVAREVGTEGKLGGQAHVPGVAGTWKDLTDNVNSMGGNLTNQVRGIATVVTAVANGDLKRKLVVDAKGEIAELADTINGMIDTLAIFADQVTTMAREVGVEGKLGGQASVPGASGIWKDLTDNVNQLAANLTTQVRAIADVATAVTRGDLTRSIKVLAQGEVAALKDNINEMIRNLKDTTRKNAEQDWLKTNLAKFSRMLQGQKDMLAVAKLILSELAPVVDAQHGAFFIMDSADSDKALLRLLASYAYKEREHQYSTFRLGEGLVGQCAVEKEKIQLTNVPPDYIRITSGLGEAPPPNIVVLPILVENQVKAVMELATCDRLTPMDHVFLDQLCESIGIVLNTIQANTRTEDLLKQSQSLASELQSRQEELQQTNAELQDKAKLLARQNVEVERKSDEVEQARQALEEKAKQLSLTSKYKSEFLANMSHELRTPLNSLLILSDQLCRNSEGNLTQRQIEFAQTILLAGNDLLNLINDILDLTKIESGTVVMDVASISFRDLADSLERTFSHVAEDKQLAFDVHLDPALPRQIQTDAKRLQQIIKNLLANAFKFTERGFVRLSIEPAESGWSEESEPLNQSDQVIAISVADTGIGIPLAKQQIIFEAFQQADGSTNRKYGGTGLGLAISREIAQLLGGEIRLQSEPGEGSTFTLFLSQTPAISTQEAFATPPAALEFTTSGEFAPAVEDAEIAEPAQPRSEAPLDDTQTLLPGDRVLLIVENDLSFARILTETARMGGWKVVLRTKGSSALQAAREFEPSAISLDLNIGDADGWNVLSALKDDLSTRHIPICVISTDDKLERTIRMGAMGALKKPIADRGLLEQTLQRLTVWAEEPAPVVMVIGLEQDQDADSEDGEMSLRELLPNIASLLVVQDLDEFKSALAKTRPDVLIVQQQNGSQTAQNVLQHLIVCDTPIDFPILVDLCRTPGDVENATFQRMTESLPLRLVRTPERLIDDLNLLLHTPVSSLPEEQQRVIQKLHDPTTVLAGKCVLIVDDDIRNIFAMTSILERYEMQVHSSETGAGAIRILQDEPGIDIVLMDIMMPELDGYQTMRAIRQNKSFGNLPIIALTAKAMMGDREKCIDAGASDYIAKPVRADRLVAILSNWLSR